MIFSFAGLYSGATFAQSSGDFEITGLSWRSYDSSDWERQLPAAKADAWERAAATCGEGNAILKKSDWTVGWGSHHSPYSDEPAIWRWARAVFECQR